ncbi:golgin subfamily B member 1-like [Saccostrea echinata]|uniref:golgin subfamily B member 1-like n=1 Tax=Saccostrea echinata TaxID=191078 RepID=UPI002A7FE7E3|nr:golgin subfamily B member 1-like [Saccostrea echinata]
MADDERIQKLKAGKQKLAEFQKKRKKKKTVSPRDDKEDVAMGTGQSEASLSSSGDVSLSDSDQGNTEGRSDDTRTLLKTQTSLYAAYDRIEELEESLTGKQLALDKVISENDQLQKKIQESKLTELEAAVRKREELIVQLSSALQTVTNQTPSDTIATEMAQEVQLLKNQLQNASKLLEAQSEKYNSTTQTLLEAKAEIAVLQKNLRERDKGHQIIGSPGTNQDALQQGHDPRSSAAANQEELSKLQQELQEAKTQIVTLQEQIRETGTGSEEMNTQNQGQLEALQEVVRSKDNQIAELQSTVSQSESECEKLKNHVRNLESSLSELNDLKQKNERLKCDIKIVEEQNSVVVQQLRNENMELKDSVNSLNEKNAKETECLKTEISELKLKISDLEENVKVTEEVKVKEAEELKVKVKELEKQLKLTKETAANDSGELDLLKADYELLTDTLKLKNERIMELEQALTESKHEIEMELLRGDNERLSEEVIQLEEKLESSEKNIAEKGRRLESFCVERDMLVASLEEKDEKLSLQESSIVELQQEKEQQALELDQLNEDLENALLKCKRTEDLELQLEALVSQLNSIQQECQCYRIQNDELKNRINVQQDLYLSQQYQIEVAGSEKEKLLQENLRLGSEKEELTSEIQRLKEEVENYAKKDLDELEFEKTENQESKEKSLSKVHDLETTIQHLKEENSAFSVKVQSLEDQILGLQKDLQNSQDEKWAEIDQLHDSYKQELLDKDDVINTLQTEIKGYKETLKSKSPDVRKPEDWETSENDGDDSITEFMLESVVEDLLCQSEATIEKEAGQEKEATTQKEVGMSSENVCEEMEFVQEEFVPVSHVNLSSMEKSDKLRQNKFDDVKSEDGTNSLEHSAFLISQYEEEISKLSESLAAHKQLEDVKEKTLQSVLSELESMKEEKYQDESAIRSVLNLDPDISLDSENFLKILRTLENQKCHLLEKLEKAEAEKERLLKRIQNAETDDISCDSLNLEDSIDEDNVESNMESEPGETEEMMVEDDVEDGVDGVQNTEMLQPIQIFKEMTPAEDTVQEQDILRTAVSDTDLTPDRGPSHAERVSSIADSTHSEAGDIKLEGLRSEYESQLDSLREELARQTQGEMTEKSIRDIYQQEMVSFKEGLDQEHQQQLERILQGVGEMISRKLTDQHTKYQEEFNLQLQAMRLTLEQIYQGQMEVMTSEQEQRHLVALQELRDSLNKEHSEEMSRVEAEWTSRMSELEREHEDELNDSLMEDSLSSEMAKSNLLHKLNKKLSEEHKQLLKKISEGLDRHDPRLRSPRKSRHTQGQQTDSEDGETDSIRSLPVTGLEFSHLDEREKVLHNAQDVQETLETQREEIAALRSRMLEEYEQLLKVRAEVMATQTQEVEKLQREMDQLHQSYAEQIKVFQTKVEEQSEEAMQTRLKEEHEREIQDLKDHYESQIKELRSQLEATTQEVTSLKQEVTSPSDEQNEESSDQSEANETKATDIDSRIQELEKLLEEKSNEIDELQEKLELESQLNIELREKMTLTESKVTEMEQMMREKQCHIEEMNNRLKEKEAILKILEREKDEVEEKCRKDIAECEETSERTTGEISDKLLKLQQELDASLEQERDMEHEHRAEIMDVQSEFKVQLEIELKRQAADMTYDFGEKIKKMEEDQKKELGELERKIAELEMKQQKDTQEETNVAVNLPESSSENYPESSAITLDDDPDSLSKSTETASTVIDAQKNVKPEKKISEDSGDKTDDELEEMESEGHEEGGKPSKMEAVSRQDTFKESEDFEEASESSSPETSESQSAVAVSQLMGTINLAKQETFMKLKQEYEAKITKLTDDLEQAMVLNDEREKCIDDITEKYEAKINEMRVHYEMRIKELEESDVDIEELKEKVKVEFVKDYKAELAQVHTEYEEKMNLLRQEMQESNDLEKQEIEKRHKKELEASEEKYDTLVDRIRGGDAPEVADLVRDRIDTELEMAKSLMEQEFEETIESEQARFQEEKEKEINDLHAQHEKEIKETRQTLTEEFQAKLESIESKYSKEMENLQRQLETGMHQTLATEDEIQKYQDKIHKLETELEKLVKESESSDEKSSKRTVDESGVMVSASSEFDTDGETKDSGKGTKNKGVDQTDSSEGFQVSEIYEETSETGGEDLRDSGGLVVDQSVKDYESESDSGKEELTRRDSSADLDNSIQNLKGSHAAAIAEIEEEYNSKLASLKAELSSTKSSLTGEVTEGQGQRPEKDDLDLAHTEELHDLEIRLMEKHSQDLFNLENQYKERIQEIQQHHQEEVNNLKKVVEYFQQTANPEKSQELKNLSSPGPKRSTPVSEMDEDDDSSHGNGTCPQERSVDLIQFESSYDDSSSVLEPPTEKPPALPRDAGSDVMTADVIETVQSTKTEAPPEKEVSSETGSGRSTPTDLLQTMSGDLLTRGLQTVNTFGSSNEFSTGEQHTETTSLATELRDKEVKIKELENEIESLQAKFAEIVERRERENEESRNLEVMLRTDLDRLHVERETVQSTNDHLLQLLSDAVKTYLNVEDAINRKLAIIVTGDQGSPSVQRRSPPSRKQRSPPGSHPRSPPGSHHHTPPEPSSPGGAEGGDVPPHETSLLSNLTDEGLDLSQRTITESIFQGPDLDTEGEELLTDASNRLQSSVSRLLDMIEDTTHQLYDTKRTQHELVTTVSSEQQESLSISTRCEELEERLREEVEAKEYLAMELHKAEGLIEGYSTERDQREQQVRDLEEKTEALVLELETTKNRLLDLEASHHEATSLRSEMQRQRELLNANVGDQAQVTVGTVAAPSSDQALMLELNKLNDEKRNLQLQLRTTTEKYDKRVADLENAGEETERHYVQLLEEKKSEVEDLRLQLDSVEKQLKSNRHFIEEQANEREQERDEFQREVDKLKKAISDQERKQAAENRLQREVENLTEELQDRIDSHSEIVMQTERLQRDLSDKQMTTEELTAVVRQLEQELEERAKTEQEYKQKISQLQRLLERRRSVGEMSDKQEEEEEEEDQGHSESESTGSETRAMRRRRKLPSHISLQQEEALYQEKEQLQIQLEDQLKQISALRNQLDEMRHRGDYSGSFGDESQTTSLQRQVDNQREVTEEKDKEIAELKERLADMEESLSNKEKLISQLTNQIQASKETSQSEGRKENQVEELQNENEDLKRRLRSLEKEVDTTPMSVLTQNLIEEKNQEIDHLNNQIEQLRFQISALKSGEALAEMQSEVDKLRADLEKKEMELVRASQASTFSDISDNDGVPGVSESFTEKTNLQQELEDSVAQRMEEYEQLKSALQLKEEEIVTHQQTIKEKEEEIAGLNMTLDEKMMELENKSRELSEEKSKQPVTSPAREDAYLNEILQEKETLIEQMNLQIEGLNGEVESLTDFQNKLQEDFDTVQQMLEEKEKEIDTLTRELSERVPEDHSEELLKLEMEISKLKKDLKEKDNVIEEKAEEMYLLNEKLEQQEAQTGQQSLSQKLAEKESEILSLQNKLTESAKLRAALEERTREAEEIRAELSQVKERLAAGGDTQTRLEQTSAVNSDLLLKEKEAELEKVKAEFASFKESLQSAVRDIELQENCNEIQRLKQELTAIRGLIKQDEKDEQVIQRMLEMQHLKEQLSGIRDLVREGAVSEVKLSKEEVEMLRKRLKSFESQEELSSFAEDLMRLRQRIFEKDYEEQLKKKNEEIEHRDVEIQKLKEELEDLDNKEEEIQRLRRDLKSLAEKENEIQWLRDELDSVDEHENEMKKLKQQIEEKDEEIQGLRRDLKSLADKENQIQWLKEELQNCDDKGDETEKLKSEIKEKDLEIQNLNKELVTLKEKDREISRLEEDLKILEDKENEIQKLQRNIKYLADKELEKDSEIVKLLEEVNERDRQIQELRDDLENLAEKEDEIETLRAEIQRMVENQESLEEERMSNMASPRSKTRSPEDSLSQELENLKVKVTSQEEELDNLNEELTYKKEEIRNLSSDIEEKKGMIQELENEIEAYKHKQDEQFQKLRAFEEQLEEVKKQGAESEGAWSHLQLTQEQLEQTAQELTTANIKLTEAEQNLGVVSSQLLDKENDLQALQAEYWEKTVKITDELQQANTRLKQQEEEIQRLQSLRPKSEAKQELDVLLSEKDHELQDVKQRLREAVELSEQQLRIVEQKDEEFMKLKLEIQQMIAEKDRTIRDLKKQLTAQSSSSELEISQLQQEVESKRETLDGLEKELRQLKGIQDLSLEAGGDAISLVTLLKNQLKERDDAIKEIHGNLQKSQQELESKSEELETKSRELRDLHAKLTKAAPTSQESLSEEAARQFHQLEQELRTAKEALAEMQRQAGGVSRESSAERQVFREGSPESEADLELMDVDELRRLVLDLRHDLDLSRSEVELFRKSASMSAKDFVQKVIELREELSSQHQRHIQDLTDRNRLESDTNLAQLRIKYEDEIEHIKKLHQKEIAQKIGETTRDLEKQHKTEINSMLARHKHEIEMLRIREPVLESHDASVLNLANQLGSEVAMTEHLDSQLIRSLAQRPDGQDTTEASDVAESEISVDENVPSRLQVLMNRLHKEGVQMLSMSELQFLNRHMPPSQVNQEVDLRSLQAAWENEKQSLLSAVQSLKDLLAQTHKVRGIDKAADVSDWRGELLRSIGYVFAKERETLLAELRSHVLSHPNIDLSEIQKLEQKIRNQEAHQKSSLEQIFSADRQSLLAEIRDLRAHANVSVMRHQEEKERLTEQLNNVEDQTSKRERQLKRQVQLLEYKLQQEKIIQDDLRTSLEVERDRSSDLSTQLSREKNSNLDLQTDLSNQQIQISKLKDALEREQSRFISVTGALEEEKSKSQHLSELLERERASLRQMRSKVEEVKLESDSKERQEHLLERLQSELNAERDRRLQAENGAELEKVALANLQQELDLERKNLRSTESEYKARVKQLTTAVELERAKSNDLQGALERERAVNDKLRENLDSERRSLLESTDRENSIFEDMQLELDSERAKVNDLKNSVEREKQRLQSQVTLLESQSSALKEELEQERLACRQMKNEIDQIQLQKLDITRHYEHERDQVSRLKSEREHLRSEVKSLKDMINEKERTRDSEKVSERRSQRQLERERDDQKMKMHENELEIQRLTQRVLDMEDQITVSREREMEAVRELQQEKLRTSQHHADSEGSEEDQDHWNVYKTQLESICQSLQYLILQYQDQLSSGVQGAVNVHGLERSLKDLLGELKQTQMPLALESDNTDNLMSRPSAQAVNERVLHHNSELTNFVTRLTEEKMELRNTLGRLEEEIWRYRQRGSEHQNGHDESHHDQENRHLEARAAWAKERLSLQLSLNQMERELDKCRADLRYERERTSVMSGQSKEGDRDRIQRLYGKYLRADSYRKALVYQKKYLLLLLGGFQDCEQTTLALIARMGAYPSPEDLQRGTRHRRPFTMFRSAARVVVAVSRMRFLVRKWKRATRVGSPVMGGTVDLQQGYTPDTHSFSPPRINTQSCLNASGQLNSHSSTPVVNTQSRLNGFGPLNSHPSTPLNPNIPLSPYSPSYMSSSYSQRDVINGSTHQPLEGASGGYQVNWSGIANGISPYQSVGRSSEGYHANGNFSVHMTPPTRDYSSKPHPSSENSGARRKILSSTMSTPSKSSTASPVRRVRISEPESVHDDYINRLESLQQRLSNMDSGTPKSRSYPRR